jgi:endonuclease G
MVPSLDMRRNKKVQWETFYLSNIVPQNHILNGGLWADIETLGHCYAKQYGDIHIITGTLYNKPLPNGRKFGTIGPNKVAIPQWLYKIFVRKTSEGFRVLAFEVPNITSPPHAKPEDYLVSMQTIERDSGLNFLAKMPRNVQLAIKKAPAKRLWYLDTENGADYFRRRGKGQRQSPRQHYPSYPGSNRANEWPRRGSSRE